MLWFVLSGGEEVGWFWQGGFGAAAPCWVSLISLMPVPCPSSLPQVSC